MDARLEINELPIGKWTRDYKNMLEEMAQKNEITDIKEFHKDNVVRFVLKVPNLDSLSNDEIEKRFKLTTNLTCGNMVLFDKDYTIKKYADEIEILEEFYGYRYEMY